MEELRNTLNEWMANPWIRAATILAGSIIAAKLADWIITRVLRRLTAKTPTDFDDKVIAILHRPIFLSVVLLGLSWATVTLELGAQPQLITLRLLRTLTVAIWAVAGFRVFHAVLHGLGALPDRMQFFDARTVPLFDNLAKLIVAGIAIYALLKVWNLDPGPWLASAGIVGIALGFAAKDTLANLFGGLFILADAPYKIGDYIVLDSGERGEVTHVGLRSTRLLTRDDVEVTLPNNVIANAKIVNESGGPYEQARVTCVIGVAYGSDVDQVTRVLLDATREVGPLVEDPEPRIRFTSFGDSALVFRVLAWVREPALRGLALHELNTAVYKGLNEAGISIPFPQRDVHIKEAPWSPAS